MAKKHKSMRLSKIADRQLKWLTNQYLMSESEVIQMALDAYFKSDQAKAVQVLLQMTDEEIKEELRQLREIPDGDEDVEHPDSQYTDYPYPEK